MKLNEIPSFVPSDVIEDIVDTLGAYDQCDVWFESGKWNVIAGTFLSDKYASDHFYLGNFKRKEMPERLQIISYINAWQEYPANYHGERDYDALASAKERYADGILTRGIWDIDNNGNLYIKEIRSQKW